MGRKGLILCVHGILSISHAPQIRHFSLSRFRAYARLIHVVLKIVLRVNATENDGIFRAYGKLVQPRVLPFFLRPVEMYLPSRFAVGRFILIVIKRLFPFCEAEIGDAHP